MVTIVGTGVSITVGNPPEDFGSLGGEAIGSSEGYNPSGADDRVGWLGGCAGFAAGEGANCVVDEYNPPSVAVGPECGRGAIGAADGNDSPGVEG